MRMCLELSVALLLYNLIYRFKKHPYFGQNSYVELEECRPKLFSVILPQIHGFGCKKNLNSWLVVQNLKIARSRGFMFPEAFRLTLVKGIVRIKNVELRPLIKARERKEKSFLIGRKVSTNQKQKR